MHTADWHLAPAHTALRQLLQGADRAGSGSNDECEATRCYRPNSEDSDPFRSDDKCFFGCSEGTTQCCCECSLTRATFWCLVTILPAVLLLCVAVCVCCWRRHTARRRVAQQTEALAPAQLYGIKYMLAADRHHREKQRHAEVAQATALAGAPAPAQHGEAKSAAAWHGDARADVRDFKMHHHDNAQDSEEAHQSALPETASVQSATLNLDRNRSATLNFDRGPHA